MNTVTRGLVVPVLDWVRGRGFRCEHVFDGALFDEAALRADVRRIPWADYVRFYERLADEVGGADALSELLGGINTPAVDWILRAAGGPRPMYQLWTHLGPLLWGVLDVRIQDLPDGALQVSFRVPADAAPGTCFFQGTTGVIAAMTRRLGQPTARVQLVHLGSHEAVWTVELPAGPVNPVESAPVSWALFEEMSRLTTERSDTLRELERVREQAVSAASAPSTVPEQRIREVTAGWVLTRAQAEVLNGVVRGLSNKEIANELGKAEATVEVHVTRILRKSGASGRTGLVSRFWTWPQVLAS
jgi:DNA-binding CsgD family transcriptional regulator